MQVDDELLVSYGEQYFKKSRRVKLTRQVNVNDSETEEEDECSDTEAPAADKELTDESTRQTPVLQLKAHSM